MQHSRAAIEWGNDALVTLAEALRTPLLQLRLEADATLDPQAIRTITDHALADIEAYLAILNQSSAQLELRLEPIAPGSIIKDSIEKIRPYARLRSIDLQLDDHAKHQPVLAHAKTITSAIELIMRAICDVSTENSEVSVRADTRHGYPRIGVYRKGLDFDADEFSHVQKILKSSRVSVGTLGQLGTLRVLMAAELLKSMNVKLRSAIANGNRGLAFELLPSSQIGMF